MNLKGRALQKILLIAGFILLILVLNFRQQLRDIFSFNVERLKIYYENFFVSSGRHPPATFAEKETELKLYVGDPFRDFDRDEWNEFWELVYGMYPKGDPGREGLPKKMRQLTEDELSSELMRRYPYPFTYFRDNHWKLFFELLYKK